jgi:glycerophosphoryl diester phosphodiesterase
MKGGRPEIDIAGRLYIMAHRGGRAWSKANSLGNIRRCIELGIDFIEIDICRTKHGVVLYHPQVLDVVLRRDSSICARNDKLEDIRALDFRQSKLFLDFKGSFSRRDVDYLISFLAESRLLDKVVFYNYGKGIISYIDSLKKGVTIGRSLSIRELVTGSLDPLGDILLSRHYLLSSRVVTRAHKEKRLVIASMINNARELKWAKRLPIDGINTDYPERMKARL